MSATQSEARPMSPAAPMLDTHDREVIIERTFDAPKATVWAAFTDPKHLDMWWGPNGFRNETSAHELKVGGEWRFLMHGPDGKAWVNWVRYQEIVKGEKLVYDHGGETNEPQFHVTITFTAVGQRTRVKMQSVFPTAAVLAEVKKYGAIEGGFQTLARLTGHLLHFDRSENAMVLTRVFDAPAALVYRAWTTKEALAKWWGPKGFTTRVEQLEFKVGGAYRMVMVDPSGTEYPFHGTFKEIVENQRIVFDAIIDHLPAGNEVTSEVTFVEENGKTLLTVRQDRPADAMAAKGQREGWSGQLEKLAPLLKAS
jgi:uncharacterized protein YndB with AHSA1/START domain